MRLVATSYFHLETMEMWGDVPEHGAQRLSAVLATQRHLAAQRGTETTAP